MVRQDGLEGRDIEVEEVGRLRKNAGAECVAGGLQMGDEAGIDR